MRWKALSLVLAITFLSSVDVARAQSAPADPAFARMLRSPALLLASGVSVAPGMSAYTQSSFSAPAVRRRKAQGRTLAGSLVMASSLPLLIASSVKFVQMQRSTDEDVGHCDRLPYTPFVMMVPLSVGALLTGVGAREKRRLKAAGIAAAPVTPGRMAARIIGIAAGMILPTAIGAGPFAADAICFD